MASEFIAILKLLDPYFDDEACTIFKATFGFNTAIANDVLNARLTRMITRVTKDILSLPEKKETTVSVRMPSGWKYTVSQVEKQIITFVKERQDYYQQNLTAYIAAFEEAIEWLQNEPGIGDQPEFQRYMDIIDELKNSNIVDARGNADIVWANQYERDVLIPALPDDLKKKFIWSKSVVKYLPLKIKGEVIGTLLTHLRMQMTSEMMQAADLKQYVDNAMKKTVVFTSYVDTIELAYNYFQKEGYSPLAVYGKTASELTNTVKRFQEDQSLNPLIASLKMLSTGATLTAANTVIFLNKPWRSIEYQQASDRVHRIGQDTACEIISLVLDTGKEANLSTRMEDIMQWSGDQFDQIVDKKERENVKAFFRGFESLDIPEDCVESVERGPTVVKPKNDKVFCAFVKDTNIKLPTKGKRVLVNADILHAMGFCCKSATWSDMPGTVTFKISGMVDQIRSHIVIEYRDLRTGSKTRAPDTSRLSFELVVYQINTSKLPGYFLAEGDEDQHLLRYMGDPNDIDLSKIEPLPPYKDVTIAYQYNPKIRGDHKPTTKGTESLTLPASSITLKELDLSNQVEVKYVTNTADLIDDDPDDYKKWTLDDVKTDLKKGRQFFLLMHGSEVVGSIGVMIYKDNTVDLYNLGIFPKYQGKGYGKQGLSATIQHVLTHHPKTTEIYICVYKTNQKAYHLYESMGFKIVETREKTYLMVLKNKLSDNPEMMKKFFRGLESLESLSDNQKWKTYDSLVTLMSEEDKIHFKSMCGAYLYHGSPLKYKALTPQMRTDMDRPVLCVTPFMGVAAWFCAPETALGRGEYTRKRVLIKEWFDNKDNYDGVKDICKTVHIHHNIRQIPNQTVKHTGYIHFIKTEDIIDDIVPYNRWSRSMEGWYFGKPITPTKVVPIEITVVLRYDSAMVKEAGGDAIPIPSNESFSMEAQGSSIPSLVSDSSTWSTEVVTPFGDKSFTKKWTYGKYVKDDTLYRCMDVDVPVLTPHQDIDGQEPEPSVNLTPSIAMALMFGTPRNVLIKGTYSNLRIHFGTYIDMDNFYDPISVAKYRTNVPNVDRTFKQKVYLYRVSYSKYKDKLYATAFSSGSAGECCTNIPVHYESKQEIVLTVNVRTDPEMVKKYGPAVKLSDSTEQLTPSNIAQKKKKILDFICKLCDTMEPSGLNSKRYRQIIGQMNDKEFDQFMNYMKEGKWQLHLVAPNMIVNLQNEDLLKACDLIGLDLFQRVWMYDRATGRKYLTDNKYMFVKLPIRRQQQFLDEKISVPDNDRTIDGLTGQVTGDSRSCSITNPEIQILAARGLDKTMQELVNIRGGNIHGYSEFRRMLEENGEADLDMIDPNSRTRASVVGSKLLQSMMLDTNL